MVTVTLEYSLISLCIISLQLVVVLVAPRVVDFAFAFLLSSDRNQGTLLFSTMSFVLNSTVGMGRSDSRGSIHQTLVEWEVIPIGDSSLEEVCHEDQCHVGEGSSPSRERVGLSTTPLDEEHVPFTIVIP